VLVQGTVLVRVALCKQVLHPFGQLVLGDLAVIILVEGHDPVDHLVRWASTTKPAAGTTGEDVRALAELVEFLWAQDGFHLQHQFRAGRVVDGGYVVVVRPNGLFCRFAFVLREFEIVEGPLEPPAKASWSTAAPARPSARTGWLRSAFFPKEQ